MAAAKHERRERRTVLSPTADDECADSFRPADLVTADADQIDPFVTKRHAFLGEALGRVGMKVDGLAGKLFRNLANRLHDSGFIINVHYRHEKGIIAHGFGDRPRGYPSAGCRPHQRYTESAPR